MDGKQMAFYIVDSPDKKTLQGNIKANVKREL